MEFARLKSRPGRAARPAMTPAGLAGWLARPGPAFLLAALAIEFVDELVDGSKSAAMPLIRHDLALSYVQIGLLAAVPLTIGSLLELPLGVISGTGRRRWRVTWPAAWSSLPQSSAPGWRTRSGCCWPRCLFSFQPPARS